MKINFFKDESIPAYLFIFVFSIVQLVDKILPMSGFELEISGVWSDRSTNWATATARKSKLLIFEFWFK